MKKDELIAHYEKQKERAEARKVLEEHKGNMLMAHWNDACAKTWEQAIQAAKELEC